MSFTVYPSSRHQAHGHLARVRCATVDGVGLLGEIVGFCGVDVAEGLRVAIDKREPRALHLDHQAVAGAHGVEDVR